ncbi:MAG: hypothetical protein GXZ15_02475 [Campylobacter sp.]|nr:hypothetical protein [Campylobacter sp.]
MKKIILSAALLWVAALAEEVSVFGAGNIASGNPYGLTENEQILLDSKKRVDQVVSTQKLQEEDMIGLRTVVEGSQNQVSKLESRVSDLEIRTTGKVSNLANPNVSVASKQDIQELKNEIADLKTQIEIINQKLGIQTTSSVKKNSNTVATPPVAKVENNPVVVPKQESVKKETVVASPEKKQLVKPESKKVVGFDDMKPSDIEKEAISLYNAKSYTDAKIHYEYLSNKGYELGKTKFMLGEISYNQKSYTDAISHYQDSLKSDDKADYIPELLYHSGVSLEKLGDTENADKFYSYLKTKYPESTQAKSLQK